MKASALSLSLFCTCTFELCALSQAWTELTLAAGDVAYGGAGLAGRAATLSPRVVPRPSRSLPFVEFWGKGARSLASDTFLWTIFERIFGPF